MKRGSNTKSAIMNEDVVQSRLSSYSPKRQFVEAAMNMGWQLAGTVLIPVIIGVKLDEHFKSSPSYTLGALVLACGGAVMVVSNVIKKVNQEQAAQDASTRKAVKSAK